MRTLKEIANMICLKEEVKEELLLLENELNLSELEEYIKDLTSDEHWQEAWGNLKTILSPDKKGFKILFCMLKAAAFSYERYIEQGISEVIFTDTMKCFTRFLEEHRKYFGYYGFDRDFWTGRQLSLQLFRLGELEFEKCRKEENLILDIHIPSDAILTEEKCKESVEMSMKFFKVYDSQYVGVPYYCNSWLLSPALKELLTQDSRILKFQELFEIEEWDQDSKEYMGWVFKSVDIPIDKLPETTSLQKNIKNHLLKGGKIGDALGVLNSNIIPKNDPFID